MNPTVGKPLMGNGYILFVVSGCLLNRSRDINEISTLGTVNGLCICDVLFLDIYQMGYRHPILFDELIQKWYLSAFTMNGLPTPWSEST